MKKIQRLIMFVCMFTIVGLGQAFGQDPAIICPSDITLSNDQDYTDTDITGLATAFDINGEVGVEFTDIIINLDANNDGFVRRRFNVVDRTDIFCDQTITMGNNNNVGPTLIVEDITTSVDPWACTATIEIPQPLELDDDCTSDPTYTISGPAGITIVGDAVVGYTALAVPLGVHTFTYTASDCFGNITSVDASFTVIDGAPPVTVAKQNIVITLTSSGTSTNGLAKLYAESVDNGSYDGCSNIKLEIRKDQNNYNCDNIGNATYNDDGHPQDGSPDPNSPNYDPDNGAYITFSCADASNTTVDVDGDGINDGGYVKVWLRVWDDADFDGVFGTAGDNYNETWTYVKVKNSLIVDESQSIYLGLLGANSVELTADMLSYFIADDCDQFSATFSQSTFSAEGTYSVEYTFSDQYNNSSTGTVTVIVMTADGIACNNNVNVSLDGDGKAIISPDMMLEGGIFANADYNVSINGGPYNKTGTMTCSHIGENEISIRDENSGNECWSIVNIEDKLAPVLSVPSTIYLTLNVPTEALLTADMLDRFTYDNCTIISQTLSQGLFSSAGVYVVTYTVTDGSGNVTVQTFDVDVSSGSLSLACNDNTDVILGVDNTVTVDFFTQLEGNVYLNGNYSVGIGYAPDYEPATYTESVTLDCSYVGEEIALVIKDENNGNKCWGQITVLDKKAPTPYAQSVISVSMNGAEPYVLNPSLVDLGSFDNCDGDLSMTVTPNTFYAPGTYMVKLRVYDESGNSDFAMSTLIVDQGNGTPIECVGLSTALTNQWGPTTLWAVDFVLNPDDFDSFSMSTNPNGPFTETIDFDCAQYNMNEPFNIYVQGINEDEVSTCVVSLTLIDNTPPVVVTDQGITLQLQNCQAILFPASVDDGSYDLCGEVTLSLSQTLFTSNDIGENEVTLTVTDASGNTNQGVTIITVVGNNDDCNGCTVDDVFFPSDITITDENGVLGNLSIENLQSVYNYSYEQVYPFTTAQCDNIAYAYEDQVFNTVDGYKILRTFTALDWTTTSIKTKTQIIQLYTETNDVLACNGLVQINLENGNYQVLPEYVLEGGNYDYSTIVLTIEDENGNTISNNILTPNYIGQLLTYTVTDTASNLQCWGTISVSDNQGYCPMNIDTDVTFPLDEIYLPNSNISSSEYTPENLEANYGFEESEVDVTVHAVAPCVVIGWTYQDEVFNYADGSYKIVRTFTVIDWYTYNPPSTAGIYTHVQTINVGIKPNDLICDILPNDAPVGDCSTGHSLEDDVEWPSDLAVSDYRITPEGLVEYSGVSEENASPIFFNTPDEYSATYIDLLVELTPTTLTVARIWKAVNSTYNLTWNYSQTIVVDFSEFENLVTVHTATNRPIPGVMFNNNYTTNIDGEAQVLEEIVSIVFEDEVRNGLFLDDILLIQRHILGIELLDEDIMWAADVNSNGQITGADIIELRKRITGESQEIEWNFTNTQNEDNSIVQPKATYLAYKKGDVNDNAIFSIEDEIPITANIIIEDKVLNNGETYMIPIKVENLDLVMGMEIRLELNNDFVEYIGISNNTGFEDLEVIDRGDGEVIIFAVDPSNAQNISTDINNAVVYIEFKAKANILLHDAINITNSTSYAVDENLVLHAIGGKIENMITGTNSLELASVKVFPNPTTDYLRIDYSSVSVKGDFTAEILNTQGQLISRQSNDVIDVKSLSQGIYYYKITIGDYVKKGKFIVIP